MDADDELIAELRRVTNQMDPPPADLRAAAAAAFAFRDPDAALAALVGDSDQNLAWGFEMVRADDAGDHVLSYESDGARVDLEATITGDGPVLTGQLLNADREGCELENGNGDRIPIPVDEFGRFLLTDVPAGPARLHFRSSARSPIVTPWFVL